MANTNFLLLFTVVGVVYSKQKCTRIPRELNGKPCASTTRYHDGRKGACGCGPAHGDSQFWWNKSKYVAAANQIMFDNGGYNTWCGKNCGKCVKLTTTGGYVEGQGKETAAGTSRVFMITNDCPIQNPNLAWCGQHKNGVNRYGYGAHFDLENGAQQITQLDWDNPEVTYEFVDCHGHNTPSDKDYRRCQCSKRKLFFG